MSDQSSPDSIKLGEWLFRHRTALPLPVAVALLLVRAGQAPPSSTFTAAGVGLTGLGELVRLWAVRHIGVISRTRSDRLGPLIATGPFAWSRNPLYLGNIALWAGFALTARLLWMAPVIVVLLAAEYQAIVRWEERLLETRHGERYRAYASAVPRWMPGVKWGSGQTAPSGQAARSAPSSGIAGGQFSWRETVFSERGTLLAIAAGYLLLWLKFKV